VGCRYLFSQKNIYVQKMKNKGLSDVEGVAEQVSKPPSLYKNTHAHIYKDTIMHNKSS